jgi:hypothetical protein
MIVEDGPLPLLTCAEEREAAGAAAQNKSRHDMCSTRQINVWRAQLVLVPATRSTVAPVSRGQIRLQIFATHFHTDGRGWRNSLS